MKVKITGSYNVKSWYNEYIGDVFEVNESKAYDDIISYVVVGNSKVKLLKTDTDGTVNYYISHRDCEVVTEPQYLTKEEALCLCIHGTKVMSAGTNASTEHYMDFNGIHFEWHHGKHKGIVNSMPTKFKLWEPPKPKFTVDSFVVFEEDYVKIIAAEYKHGSHRYYVSKGTYVNCKEDCMIADESELTAV